MHIDTDREREIFTLTHRASRGERERERDRDPHKLEHTQSFTHTQRSNHVLYIVTAKPRGEDAEGDVLNGGEYEVFRLDIALA